MFQGSFQWVVRVFERISKGILGKFQKNVSRIFQESVYGASRMFQGCFKKVSGVFKGRLKCVSMEF